MLWHCGLLHGDATYADSCSKRLWHRTGIQGTAAGTVDTVGGEISGGVTITTPGSGFSVGESVTITEVGGGELGEYTATVATIA